jgi:hypothetical protein
VRAIDRTLAVLLGAAGTLLGVLVVVEVVAARLDRPPVALPYSGPAAWLRETPWSAAAVVAGCVALLATGLLLLVGELAPRRRASLVLDARAPGVTATLSTRSVARVLENAATSVPGIERAAAQVRRRRARLAVTVPLRDPGEVARIGAEARDSAAAALDALNLRAAPRLRTRTRQEAP